MKEYIKQIGLEIKKLLTSKFLVICMGLLMLLSIATPILSKIDFGVNNYDNYYYGYDEDIVVDGVTVPNDSPLYWELMELNRMKEYLETSASTANEDLSLEYIDLQLSYIEPMALIITSYEDYRTSLAWSIREEVQTVFILDNIDMDKDELMEVLQSSGMYYYDITELNAQYYDLTEIERMEKKQKSKEAVELLNSIILNNDHIAYLNYQIEDGKDSIVEFGEKIAVLEKDIIENPGNEEIYNSQIEDYRRSISNLEDITIPMNQYRLDNDIIPQDNSDWRETALRNKESAMYSLNYTEVLSQADYEDEQYLKSEYGTYNEYKEAIEKQIKEYTETLIKADRSLTSLKPDMTYVMDGTRSKVANFLWFSLIIAIFGVIIGGALIAREFQDGTIRLLLIRPKNRAKIVLSKLFALLIICLALYAVTIVLNLVTNGIIFGFSDLGYPNYTVSSGDSGISFFAYIVPRILACTTTIFFAIAVAYFLSTITRNTALSVAIPIIGFVGSLIAMQWIGYSAKYSWIVYTPIPYINIPNILLGNYYSPTGVEPNLAFGIPLLLVLGVVAIGFSTWIFKKRDITN